jgi:hypothetical protein
MHPEFASKKTLEFSVKITATNNKKMKQQNKHTMSQHLGRKGPHFCCA